MYKILINSHSQFRPKHLWKLKLQLKTKIFLWYLGVCVILQKDNLMKRNWHGIRTCCFCDKDETIQHLFFSFHVARFVWRVAHIALNLPSPSSVPHMLGNWLNGLGRGLISSTLVGATAMCWSIWLCRNVFFE